jgi:hypothetical protein
VRALLKTLAWKYTGSVGWQAYTYALILTLGTGSPLVIAYVYWAELGRSLCEPLVTNHFLRRGRVTRDALARVLGVLVVAAVVYNHLLLWALGQALPYWLLCVTAVVSVIPALLGWAGVGRSGGVSVDSGVADRVPELLILLAVSVTGIVFARQFVFAVQATQVAIPRDFALVERFFNPLVNLATTATIFAAALTRHDRSARAREWAIMATGALFACLAPTYWAFFIATAVKTVTTADYIALLRTRWQMLVVAPLASLLSFALACTMLPRTFGGILHADLASACLYFLVMRAAALRVRRAAAAAGQPLQTVDAAPS